MSYQKWVVNFSSVELKLFLRCYFKKRDSVYYQSFFVCKTYCSAPYYKALASLKKIIYSYIFNNSKTIALPKEAILDWGIAKMVYAHQLLFLFITFTMSCHTIEYIFCNSSWPTHKDPYLGMTPQIMSKSTSDYPKNMCRRTFDTL